MSRDRWLGLALAGALLASPARALAQDPSPSPEAPPPAGDAPKPEEPKPEEPKPEEPKPGEPKPDGPKPDEPRPEDASPSDAPSAFAGQERARGPAGPVERLVESLVPSVVKVYGAGGFTGIPAYGTGVVIDERGFVLTAWSIALDTPELRVVTADGKSHAAKVWRADVGLGAALLKIDALGAGLRALRLGDSSRLRPGAPVLAVANPFGIVYGRERLSVMLGVVSGVVEPRRGGFNVVNLPERLERVVLTDIPNNPGSQGGALVTLSGELVGVLSRLIESRATNTILNVAIPTSELKEFVRGGLAQQQAQPVPKATAPADVARKAPPDLGVHLQRAHLVRSPLAYVEAVRRGSPAAAAGLRPNDLVFRVGERTIRSCRDFDEATADLAPGSKVELVVKRGEVCERLTLEVPKRPEAPR